MIAEHRRASAAIASDDLADRDVRVRRAAARALSRIADARAAELLLRALADEDPEVLSFSAFGLGSTCAGRETVVVRALVLRAAGLVRLQAAARSSAWDTRGAIADALGRCAGSEAEATLRAWLSGPTEQAEAAALALGRVASKLGRLADVTVVALLDAAGRSDAPLENALYPFTQLRELAPSVAARLLDVARAAIATPGVRRTFAIRALASAGGSAAESLGAALTNPELPALERSSAARELAKLGAAGQPALWQAFEQIAPASADADLLGESFGTLLVTLGSLRAPILGERAPLARLAELPIAAGNSARLARHKVLLRCKAAALAAQGSLTLPALLACDTTPGGRQGALALLAVLDRGKISGARAKDFPTLAISPDPVVREAALELIAAHREIKNAAALLASALAASVPGVVATAARLLASYPDRVALLGGATAAPGPEPSLIGALSAALEDSARALNVELAATLIDAAGALGILSLKTRVAEACASTHPILREHAEKALHLLGERERKCDYFEPRAAAEEAARAALTGKYALAFATDAGDLELRLDAALAPVAVARFVELARSGFYDGMAVHRVIPGFIVQFGDRAGDGFDTAERTPLCSETSPTAFLPGALGVALNGRDTGSSQLFVALARYPHLDGEYPLLGQASAGWQLLAEGDRIEKVTVRALPE